MASSAEKITSPTSPETRIINHLNNDHQRELSHYLRHYAKLSPSEALHPLLTSITFTTMKIRDRKGKTHDIPIQPPMETWADARIRAVDMDRNARMALGVEDIYVDKFIYPSKIGAIVFLFFAFNLAQSIAYGAGYLKPGTFIYEEVLKRWPWGAENYLWIIKLLGIPTALLHAGEAAAFDNSKMSDAKYGIVRGTGLWWAWVGGQAVEGMGNWFRFNEEVERKKKERDAKKH